MPGFRYALVLEHGHPADPAVFVSEVLDWDAGDELTASSLQPYARRNGAAATWFAQCLVPPTTEEPEADAVGAFDCDSVGDLLGRCRRTHRLLLADAREHAHEADQEFLSQPGR
jgi:hypothetical protein